LKVSPAGTYQVRSGDTLSGIAVRLGGDRGADDWRGLYETNRSVIGSDPDLIHAGQVLRVPGQPKPASGQPKPAPEQPKPAPKVPQQAPKPVQQQPAPQAEQGGAARVSPVAGVAGRNFGVRSAGYGLGYHTGADFSAPQGTPVKAAAGGKVIASDSSPAYGVNVRIQHPDGTYTLYGHLSGKSVQPGQQVRAGQLIGYVGSTGNSTGPHLHFEVRNQPEYRAGGFVDPMAWLARR
ncbi:M23 family metallopeptidase, partial [Streptomyces sp. WAC06614]|uniref:M23 family metallopeptidase n=1 Tax=Streptomyces sp. WAC06614 TaxID=2487416 RepID=UPI000F786464